MQIHKHRYFVLNIRFDSCMYLELIIYFKVKDCKDQPAWRSQIHYKDQLYMEKQCFQTYLIQFVIKDWIARLFERN
jgi:hypothetical protein